MPTALKAGSKALYDLHLTFFSRERKDIDKNVTAEVKQALTHQNENFRFHLVFSETG